MVFIKSSRLSFSRFAGEGAAEISAVSSQNVAIVVRSNSLVMHIIVESHFGFVLLGIEVLVFVIPGPEVESKDCHSAAHLGR